jgi:hypothetical protein
VFELVPPSTPAGEWTETVIYTFGDGTDGNASLPQAPLVIDRAGNLFGTSLSGGLPLSRCADQIFQCGTVFELSPTGDGIWTETVIHAFGSFTGDGLGPDAGLLLGGSGALVGTTAWGGSGLFRGPFGIGSGTVFGMRPPSQPGGKWGYAVLYNFGATSTDGAAPVGVTSASGTILYGATSDGGSGSLGTVFQLTLANGVWNETGLFSATNPEGGHNPNTPLLLFKGALYGATPGGIKQDGVVFRISK